MNRKLTTPEGTRDLLFEDCLLRRKAESTVRTVLEKRGYSEVITPTLEYYDVFHSESYQIPQEKMYKLTDLKGRLLALKPDLTIPIARLAATRLKQHTPPIRLYYDQTVFQAAPALSGRSDEVPQIGIELLGVNGLKADLEVLFTAVEALRSLDVPFRLEIGHIGFFNTLIEMLSVEKEEKEEIRSLIENKNYPALNDRLGKLENQNVAEALKKLPALFGGEEVLSRAETLFSDYGLKPVTDYLRKLYAALGDFGLKEQLSFDLGIVNRNDYYTGIVFQGYIEGVGAAVLFGGRYDTLLKEYGRDLPAVGFGIDVDAVAKGMGKENLSVNRPEMLVFAKEGYEAKAFSLLEKYGGEFSLSDDLEDAKKEAKQKQIPRLLVVGEEEVTVTL